MCNNINELHKKITRTNVLMFDLDNTLIETNYANYLSYSKAIRKIIHKKIDLSYNQNERFTRRSLKVFIPDISKQNIEDIIRLKNKYYLDYLAETKINKLVSGLLMEYFKTNTTILVTNCRENRAKATLKYHNIINYFNHKFYRKEETECNYINKYKNVLNALQLQPSSVIIFENEKSDIKDAISAGIPNDNIICFN